jgi:hypothetical protein
MAKKDETKSKRQVIREQRAKKQRQQRLFTILGISAVALVIAGFLIAPSLRNAMTPVGEIVKITRMLILKWWSRDGDPNAPV